MSDLKPEVTDIVKAVAKVAADLDVSVVAPTSKKQRADIYSNMLGVLEKLSARINEGHFSTNEKGDPVEEEMVLKYYGNLLEHFRAFELHQAKIKQMAARTKQIESLTDTTKPGPGAGQPLQRAGFRSKADMAKSATQVNVIVHSQSPKIDVISSHSTDTEAAQVPAKALDSGSGSS